MAKKRRTTHERTILGKRTANTQDSIHQTNLVTFTNQKKKKDDSNNKDNVDNNTEDNTTDGDIKDNNNNTNEINTTNVNSNSSSKSLSSYNRYQRPRPQQPRVVVTVASENKQIVQQPQNQQQPQSASSSISSKNIKPVDLHGIMSNEKKQGDAQHDKDESDFAEFIKQKQHEYIEWRKQQGGTTNLQEERHAVHRYVRTKLFPKLKFITCDSELDFKGRVMLFIFTNHKF
jgi:hypothetical protein